MSVGLRRVAEVLVWWAGLAALWLILIKTPDLLETVVGAGAALLSALAAEAARRAVRR